MPRYLIERSFTVTADDMPRIGARSKQVARDNFPGIVWEHSHVVVDDRGSVRTFCVYDAPDEPTLRAHAAELGEHHVDAIHEIAGDVTPDDFPL